MPIQSRAGMVQTVTGLIPPEDLGVTLTHEHILSNAGVLIPPPPQASLRALHSAPPTLETLVYSRNYSDVVRVVEDVVLLDIPTAIEEVMLYRQLGGDSLVDCSSIGLGRDPVGLARISRATGVNIVMGASYYVAVSHRSDMDALSEDAIAEQIVRDVTEGVDGTGISSGVIGEVGCTYPLTDNERKVLRASGRAQRLTGAPLLIHPGRDVTAPLQDLEVLVEGGARISARPHERSGNDDRREIRRRDRQCRREHGLGCPPRGGGPRLLFGNQAAGHRGAELWQARPDGRPDRRAGQVYPRRRLAGPGYRCDGGGLARGGHGVLLQPEQSHRDGAPGERGGGLRPTGDAGITRYEDSDRRGHEVLPGGLEAQPWIRQG
ncbi:MAG: hypothetical protein IH956_06960 [Chloroflexi bacterium]|nr:hypothetical protein [Chloroflexota bacterium]